MTIDAAAPGARPAPGPGRLDGLGVPTGPIRLLLVDDKPIVREGVRALLDREPGLRVVGQAGSLGEATRSQAALDVDVAVADLVLPDARGTEVIAGLRGRFPRAAVVVLTDVDARPQVDLVIAAGARAYVVKRATPAELVAGIRSAAAGIPYVHPSLAARAQTGRTAAADAVLTLRDGELTAPEREVVRLLVLGHTNAEIASLCAVSLRTIEARRARVLRKLGVRTRAELVRVAPRLGAADTDLA